MAGIESAVCGVKELFFFSIKKLPDSSSCSPPLDMGCAASASAGAVAPLAPAAATTMLASPIGPAAVPTQASVASPPLNAEPLLNPSPTSANETASNMSANETSNDASKAVAAPSPPVTITAQELVSGGLLLLSHLARAAPFPGAEAVASALDKIYSIFNAASTKAIWLAEFMVYLRNIELDLVGAQTAFTRREYFDQLASRLEQAQAAIARITSRHPFLAVATADADQATVQQEQADLEAIKATALLALLTEIKQDSAATLTAVEEIKRALAESEARQAALETAREERIANERLVGRLRPIPFGQLVDHEAAKYMQGTRLGMIAAVGEWIKLGVTAASTNTAAVVSSPRLFWIKGGPGTGKSCLSAVLCNTYAADIIGAHFCQHDQPGTRTAIEMIRSLAYQMAQRLPEYRDELKLVIPALFGLDSSSEEGADAKLTAEDLWQRLLVDPLHACRDKLLASRQAAGRKCVLLIDALDEATVSNGGSSAASHGASDILDLLARCLVKLPAWLGVLVTSRPEAVIVDKLKKYKPVELACERYVTSRTLRLQTRTKLCCEAAFAHFHLFTISRATVPKIWPTCAFTLRITSSASSRASNSKAPPTSC